MSSVDRGQSDLILGGTLRARSFLYGCMVRELSFSSFGHGYGYLMFSRLYKSMFLSRDTYKRIFVCSLVHSSIEQPIDSLRRRCLQIDQHFSHVTNINFQPPKCISLPFLINWVQGKIIKNKGIDIGAN